MVNFRFEDDRKVAVNFVTCVRLYALSRNQGECTPTRIKELIADDYFKLNIINKSSDVDRCLPGWYTLKYLKVFGHPKTAFPLTTGTP